jgi:hypothetical protein
MRRAALSSLSLLVAGALNPARHDVVKDPTVVDEPRADAGLTAKGKAVDEQEWYALLGDESARRFVEAGREAAGTGVGLGAGVLVGGLALGGATAAVVAFSDRDAEDKLTVALLSGGASAFIAAYGVYTIVANHALATGGERVTSFERAHEAWVAARAPATGRASSSSSAAEESAPLDDAPCPAWKIPDEFHFAPQRCHDGDAFHGHQIGLLSVAGIGDRAGRVRAAAPRADEARGRRGGGLRRQGRAAPRRAGRARGDVPLSRPEEDARPVPRQERGEAAGEAHARRRGHPRASPHRRSAHGRRGA